MSGKLVGGQLGNTGFLIPMRGNEAMTVSIVLAVGMIPNPHEG